MQFSKDSTHRRMVLSTAWIFIVLNYLYADVLTLMQVTFSGYDTSTADNAELVSTMVSPEMLLGVAIFLEMAMVMAVFSRVLTYGINRWANIIVAIIHILGGLASFLVGPPTIYYIFFVAVEVSTLLFIVWYAWTWAKPQSG